MFRISPFVYILGEVSFSHIFCFIFWDLLTFSNGQIYSGYYSNFVAFSDYINFKPFEVEGFASIPAKGEHLSPYPPARRPWHIPMYIVHSKVTTRNHYSFLIRLLYLNKTASPVSVLENSFFIILSFYTAPSSNFDSRKI